MLISTGIVVDKDVVVLKDDQRLEFMYERGTKGHDYFSEAEFLRANEIDEQTFDELQKKGLKTFRDPDGNILMSEKAVAQGARMIREGQVKIREAALTLKEAASIAGVNKGTMSRLRERYALAAGDTTQVDLDRLRTHLEDHPKPNLSKPKGGKANRKREAVFHNNNDEEEEPSAYEYIYGFLRLQKEATFDEIVDYLQKFRKGTSRRSTPRSRDSTVKAPQRFSPHTRPFRRNGLCD